MFFLKTPAGFVLKKKKTHKKHKLIKQKFI